LRIADCGLRIERHLPTPGKNHLLIDVSD
jgi:hypothetical protein